MASFINKFKNSFGKGSSKQTIDSDNHNKQSKLTIHKRPTRSNTKLVTGVTHSATFDGIVRNAATAQTFSLAQIPLQHNSTEVDETVTFPRTSHPATSNTVLQPPMNNIQVVPVDVHRPDIRTPTQASGTSLYPSLSMDTAEQVVTPVQQSAQPQQTNHSSRIGDTTNPCSDLPDRLLADEHYVADVATQHNTSTVGTLRPTSKAKRRLNLPNDYEVKQEGPQVKTEPNTADRNPSVTTPIATTSSAAQQNTGETSFVRVYDGPYGPLVRYPVGNTDETLFYKVAQILEGYLATKLIRDIAKVFLRAELDQFIKESRYANFDDFPWLRGNVRHLFETFYNHEF